MKPEIFNKYCAEVMGYEAWNNEPYPFDTPEYKLNGVHVCFIDEHNPHDELKQMAEVFDRLADKNIYQAELAKHMQDIVTGERIKQAMRDFIESTGG